MKTSFSPIASIRIAPVRFVPDRFAPVRSAFVKFAFVRFTPTRSARVRIAHHQICHDCLALRNPSTNGFDRSTIKTISLVLTILVLSTVATACGGGASTVTVTAGDSSGSAGAGDGASSTEAAATAAAGPTYAGKAHAIIVPLAALPEGWSLDTPPDGPKIQNTLRKAFFSGPASRIDPLKAGNTSAYGQRFATGSGLSLEVADHLVLVYDTTDSATTAADALFKVFKSRPDTTWKMKVANPPKVLGDSAHAWQGESTFNSLTAQRCLTVWQQANVVQAVFAGGLLRTPTEVCSSLSKVGHARAEAKITG